MCIRDRHYVHTGMIGLDGTKMSKSLGNLVFVSKLTAAGHEPSAIRLGVYAGHYRQDRDWADEVLSAAEQRLANWRDALAADGTTVEQARELITTVRGHLACDLDTPSALEAIDHWAAATEPGAAGEEAAASEIKTAIDALLGVRL